MFAKPTAPSTSSRRFYSNEDQLRHLEEQHRIVKSHPTEMTSDPIELPPVHVKEIPQLDNFQHAKEHFMAYLRENGTKDYRGVFVNPKARDYFRELFPEVVESRHITMLDNHQDETYALWKKDSNVVQLEFVDHSETEGTQQDNGEQVEHKDLLAIGGPAALVAAVLYQIRQQTLYPHREDKDKAKIMWGVTSRFDSNHDGSCYYVHERDCFAVYSNPANRGLYVLWKDLARRGKMMVAWKSYEQEVIESRSYLKLNLKYFDTTPAQMFKVFIPNLWHTYVDIFKTSTGKPLETLLAQTARHSEKKDTIINAIEKQCGPQSVFIPDSDKRMALHVTFDDKKQVEEHFTWLRNFAQMPYVDILNRESEQSFFGSDVKALLRFPRDGIMCPWAFENMQNLLKSGGAETKQSMQLKKIHLMPLGDNDVQVHSVTYKDMETGEDKKIKTNNLVFSLGPSASFKFNLPSYSLLEHLEDAIRGNQGPAYKPSLRSWYRHFLNKVEEPFGGDSLLKKFIWASGSSSVLMIGIDKSKVESGQLDVFRNFVGGENQHWTPIGERDVVDGSGKTFHFVALQMTGGGNFPTRHISADVVLNLLRTTEKMFDLQDKRDVITYDIVQMRSCGRAVSSKNAISFVSMGKGITGSYALGGIGMTTAYSNGELLNELLELRDMVAEGKITLKQMNDILASGNMSSPTVEKIYGVKEVLYGVNYHKLVDDQKRGARKLGRDESLSVMEKAAHAVILLLLVMVYALVTRAKNRRQARLASRMQPPNMTFSGTNMGHQMRYYHSLSNERLGFCSGIRRRNPVTANGRGVTMPMPRPRLFGINNTTNAPIICPKLQSQGYSKLSKNLMSLGKRIAC